MNNSKKGLGVLLLVVIIAILVISGGVFIYHKHSNLNVSQNNKKNQTTLNVITTQIADGSNPKPNINLDGWLSPDGRYSAYNYSVVGGVLDDYVGRGISGLNILDVKNNKTINVIEDKDFGYTIWGWSLDSQQVLIGIGVGNVSNRYFDHYINFMIYNDLAGSLLKKDRDLTTAANDLQEACSTVFEGANISFCKDTSSYFRNQ